MANKNMEYPENFVYDVIGEKTKLPADIEEAIEFVLEDIMSGRPNGERDKKIVYCRYKGGNTLREIGEQYMISSARAQQIINRTLRQCRYLPRKNLIFYGIVAKKEPKKDEIENLHISVGTYNCLKRRNINTVGDIVKYLKERGNLSNLRGIGERRENEIMDALNAIS